MVTTSQAQLLYTITVCYFYLKFSVRDTFHRRATSLIRYLVIFETTYFINTQNWSSVQTKPVNPLTKTASF